MAAGGVLEGEALGLMLGEAVKDALAEVDPDSDTEGEAVAPPLTVRVALGGADREDMPHREGEEDGVLLLLEVEVEHREGERVWEVLTDAVVEGEEEGNSEGDAVKEGAALDVVEREMEAVPLPVPPAPPAPPPPPPMLLRVAFSPVPDTVRLPLPLREGVGVEDTELLVDGLSLGLGDDVKGGVAEVDPVTDTEGVSDALRHSVAEVQGEADTEEVLH